MGSFGGGGSVECGPSPSWGCGEVTVQGGWLISISVSSRFVISNSVDPGITVGRRWKGDVMWLLRSPRLR